MRDQSYEEVNPDNPGEGTCSTQDLDELLRLLDPEIKELVIALRAAGFSTFTSCSGKEGHAFNKPTVRMSLYDYKTYKNADFNDERRRLYEFLESRGHIGFKIMQHYDYQSQYAFIELEFYNLEHLNMRLCR